MAFRYGGGDESLKIGDVVRWYRGHGWGRYIHAKDIPEPMVLDHIADKQGRFAIRDSTGKVHMFYTSSQSKPEGFRYVWFVKDEFLTAVRKSRHAEEG